MKSNVVFREIPEKFIKGLGTGQYKEHGGVIRDATGKIVAHLQLHNSDVLESLAQTCPQLASLGLLSSLQSATLVLSGVNLVVSVAGFYIVCQKINKVTQKLLEMDEKLERIMERLNHMEWKNELERGAYLSANMESLASGLRTNNGYAIADAQNRLREFACYFERFCEESARDQEIVFLEPKVINQAMTTTTVLRLGIAQSYAQTNFMDEALLVIENHQEWHLRQMERFRSPLMQLPPPDWLGKEVFKKNKEDWDTLLDDQRDSREGVAYTRNKFLLCKETNTSIEELCSYTSDKEPFAFILAA